jgi:hypothetical protein
MPRRPAFVTMVVPEHLRTKGVAMTTSNRPRILTAAGLVLCGAGIGILKLAGVDMPTVPPGLVIVLVAAVAVVFLPWRWAPVLGVLAALAEAAGFFASGSAPADAV